jgi:hypothetical protein
MPGHLDRNIGPVHMSVPFCVGTVHHEW